LFVINKELHVSYTQSRSIYYCGFVPKKNTLPRYVSADNVIKQNYL